MNKRKIGNKAEDKAVVFLENLGYRIIERNFYSRYGEIDIIAIDKEFFVFIEVKYRKNDSFGSPMESVSSKKIHSICRTAQIYLKSQDVPVRFDVISMTENEIKHIKSAFDYVFRT